MYYKRIEGCKSLSNKFKDQIARSLNSNVGLNKKALKLKKSWDEVEHLISNVAPSKKDKNPKNK